MNEKVNVVLLAFAVFVGTSWAPMKVGTTSTGWTAAGVAQGLELLDLVLEVEAVAALGLDGRRAV